MSVEYPFTGTVTANTYTSDLPTPKEYAWDFEKDCFLYDADGRLKIVEGDEAIKYMDLQGPEHGTLPLSGLQLAVRHELARSSARL